MKNNSRKFATSVVAAIMLLGTVSTLLLLNTQIVSAASERNSVSQHSEQRDRARANTETSNEANNDLDFSDSNDNNADQDTEQDNDCARNSDCNNDAENDGNFEDADNSNLDQNIDQSNDCNGFASCNNEGRNPATIDEDNENVQQNIKQENECAWWANCENQGETTEDPPGNTIEQSNRCAHPGTNCLTTGLDADTTCVGGADCTNDGDGKTVIGQGADCSDGPTSTRVCQGPRTLDLDHNPLD
jgi:hypothetical protein